MPTPQPPTPTPTPSPSPTPTPLPGTISGLPPLGLGFGSVGTGTNKSKTFTIKNSSKKGTLIFSLGSLAAPYAVTSGNGPFSLLPGGKQPVTVAFAPTSPGLDKVTLLIQSNTPKHPVESVRISATGAAPRLSVPAHFTVSTALRPTQVGTTVTKILTIKNTGLGVLNWQPGAVTGPFTAALIPGGSGSVLNHLQKQTVAIRFTPTVSGPIPGTLNITSNDPKHLSFNVNLKGTGSVPKVK
jgi:hypothetical protein